MKKDEIQSEFQCIVGMVVKEVLVEGVDQIVIVCTDGTKLGLAVDLIDGIASLAPTELEPATKDLSSLPLTQCQGCGLHEFHMLCPAWGTPVYMDFQHPDWGSKAGIRKWAHEHDKAVEHSRQNPTGMGLD